MVVNYVEGAGYTLGIISLENYKIAGSALPQYRDLLSVADLAEIFGVSKNTIYKEIHEGKFGTPIQIGRAFKIPKTYIINKFFINYM